MKYDKAKWVGAFQKTVADLKTNRPTQGKVGAITALRYMRDGLIDDLYGLKPGEAPQAGDKDAVEAIRESFSEAIKQVNTEGAECGFLSNTSAAAKSAGFKGEDEASVTELTD